ncbi:MAG: biotin/lipoyl-binding protein, partial [Gammaproteobacteria bacterium]
MTNPLIRTTGRLLVAGLIGAAAFFVWREYRPQGLPEGFAASNGRIEAVEIDVAAKVAGRIEDVYVDEGVLVQRGQTVAKMDTAILEAQHKEAEAALERARIAVETALSLVTQREAEYQAAEALIGLRKAELDAAQKRLARSENLAPQGAASLAQLDDDRADVHAKRAAVRAAEAQAAAARAAISQAQSNVISAKAAIEATQASLQRIQADIDDSVLKAPRDGRVQYRVAQPGEVLFPGGVVLNMVDLT